MPAGNPPVRPYPGKPFRTYGDAAEAGQLVTIRCGLCRNKRHYFAADLAEAYGPNQLITEKLFPCSRCKTVRYMDTKAHSPSSAVADSFYVRKLVGIRRVPVWKSVPFGLEDPK